MIRNIIFDWSGTLVDDLPAVWQATNHVLSRAGVPELTLERFRAEFCLPFTGFYSRFVPHIALPQLEEWFHGRLRQVQHSVVRLPHALEFLEFCRARSIRTFLLSSVHEDHFAVQQAATGLAGYLDRPYVGVWDKRQKIHGILEENELRREETLFVGDMEHDIETSRHGGIGSCAVLTGYNRVEQLRAAGPDLIVEHLGELREILEQNGLRLPQGSVESVESIEAVEPGESVESVEPVESGRETHPIPTVGALVFDDRLRVLMIRTHKWSNLWGIPGGKIQTGETAEAALRRELREETQLDICDIELVLVQDCVSSPEFYKDAHFVLLNYTCRCAGAPEVRLNEEAEEFQWLPLEEAFRLRLNTPTRILLESVRLRMQAGGREEFAPGIRAMRSHLG